MPGVIYSGDPSVHYGQNYHMQQSFLSWSNKMEQQNLWAPLARTKGSTHQNQRVPLARTKGSHSPEAKGSHSAEPEGSHSPEAKGSTRQNQRVPLARTRVPGGTNELSNAFQPPEVERDVAEPEVQGDVAVQIEGLPSGFWWDQPSVKREKEDLCSRRRDFVNGTPGSGEWDPSGSAEWDPFASGEWDPSGSAEWDPFGSGEWDPFGSGEWTPLVLASGTPLVLASGTLWFWRVGPQINKTQTE
uniref:Uncharacterized protein n=1 Tax=Ditylenchus dipsaci TaxID=166011 RepID=A0A915CXA7_9BILA